jgi:hypothetical protein
MPTTHAKNNKDGAEALKGAERRRGKRLFLKFQIRVSGTDRSGRAFRDNAVTSDVSEHGCRFDFLRELADGAFLKIQVLGQTGGPSLENKPLACQVVWIEPSVVGWTIGVEQLEPGNLWDITFPRKIPPVATSR